MPPVAAAAAKRDTTKKAKGRANGPSGESGDTSTGIIPDPAAQVQALRDELASLEAKKEKLPGWDPKRGALEDKIAELQPRLAVAELNAMPLPAAPAPAAMKFEENDIPTDSIVLTGNHREVDDEAETIRLARSLQTMGLQQRIGVRRTSDDKLPEYELIWGSRRLAATKLNGLLGIPAKVYPPSLTAAEVEILRTIENFGRKELTHVERAIAVARTIDAIESTLKPIHDRAELSGRVADGEPGPGPELREWARSIDPEKAFKGEPDIIAAARLSQAIRDAGGLHAYVGQQLGFPAKWVKDNAYVSKLGGEARKLLAAHRLDVGHARELAKLGDPQLCDDVADECARDESGLGGKDIDYCRKRVTESLRSLKVVPWRLDVAFGAGKPGCTGQACATCRFNSKSDPDLFGGALADEPDQGYCTNEACFRAKQEITEKDLDKGVAKAKAKHGKSEFAVTDSAMASFVPVHVKLSTAARKAKKEIEAAQPDRSTGDAGGGTADRHKPRALTAEEKAKEQFDEAYEKWVRASGEAVERAIREDPRKFIAAAVMTFVPPFEDAYDVDDKEVEKHADVVEMFVGYDIQALAAAAVSAQMKKEKWQRRLPLFDDGSCDALVEKLAVGWGLKVKPKPVIEDFLPKKGSAPVAAATVEADEADELDDAGPVFDVAKCRVCGCTEADCSQCIEKTGDACSWVEEDLCSACTPESRKARYAGPAAEMGYVGKDALSEVEYDALEVGARHDHDGEIDLAMTAKIRRTLESLQVKGLAEVRKAGDGHDSYYITSKGGYVIGFKDVDYTPPAAEASAPETPARAKFHKLDDDVAEVLRSRLEYVNESPGKIGVRITGELLERNLYDRVNKTLIKLGGKWRGGKTQMHLFASDPTEAIASAVGDGQVLDWKKTFQFFETPAELAARMVKLAEIRPEQKILEPSAGRGAIAGVIRERMPDGCKLELCEIDPENVAVLKAAGYGPLDVGFLWEKDFLQSPAKVFFDRILMNPPFANGQDVEHVRHAYELLKPGGRLVAIMGTSAWQNGDKRSKAFRDWLDEVPLDHEEDLPAGTFSDSGTDVAAKLIVIHKPEGGQP